ncbi:CCR4-NOT transcription complex subunit 9-like [Macrosteles quadrilineatus]|uniref:CCR4-NOT transcription complex subunit 9-like n=1 Tax=Macrosteles quadrilineatus TaxID=74068 RepID=UPI0023E0CCFE|nr:CCR4-NOT transcription complex subunit 9-like [Macrosteles quadrilineatus]
MSSQQLPKELDVVEQVKIYQWIDQLLIPAKREEAMLELCRRRDLVPEMAIWVWNAFGTIAALVDEIMKIYPAVNMAYLSSGQSNRVCCALALLQCVACHPDTRDAFFKSRISLFLYPFLKTETMSGPFENLRLTSLGVIGAMAKTGKEEVIHFLLATEITPLCLRIMESGSELPKTLATYILTMILLDDTGLNFICGKYERFSEVVLALKQLVHYLAQNPSPRLLKYVVRCYLRLSETARGREALRLCAPKELRDETFTSLPHVDMQVKHWLFNFNRNLATNQVIGSSGIVPL